MRTVRNIATPGQTALPAAAAACGDVRCGCGSLLARVVGGAVELKCRRCKHVWRLDLGAPAADFVPAGLSRVVQERAR